MINKPVINWGVLGTGEISGLFAQGLKSVPDAVLYGIASKKHENASKFASAYGVKKAYTSYEELVNDKNIDIVYIATPTALHKEHSILCLERNKPVLCEKPFAMDSKSAADIIKIARNRNIFCMEAMWMRFLPLMRNLPAMLNNSGLGDIRVIQAFLGHNHAVNNSASLFDKASGGGAMLDLGCYLISFVFSIWGEPQQVIGMPLIGKTGVDEENAFILKYDEGRMAILGCSIRGVGHNNAHLIGTKGIMEISAPLYRPSKAVLKYAPLIEKSVGVTAPSFVNNLKNNRIIKLIANSLKDVLQVCGVCGASVMNMPFNGNGYNYEAVEAMKCLRESKIESGIMPLDDSLKVLEVIDNLLGKL